ncbi:MAG: alkaline phosphatase family protein [Anaerolineaceae bacterium]|nr:alkaline phosphatase family protein [Anaerolineaceae bacterium]
MNKIFQEKILDKITTHHLLVDLPQEMIHPYYQGASIRNIPASILRNFETELPDTIPLLPEIEEYLLPQRYDDIALLLIDGLGYDWLLDYLANEGRDDNTPKFWSEIMARARISPITSISPSTTAAALTTFWTGAVPAAHGILGYELWLKEYGILSNMISHGPAAAHGSAGSLYSAGMDVETFLPVPTIGPALIAQDVTVRSMQHYSIANSGLSFLFDKGSQRLPYKTISDMFCNYEQALSNESPSPKSYTWMYCPAHDSLSHTYGAADPRVHQDFTALGYLLHTFLQRVQNQSSRKRLLLITADHGHLVTPKDPKYDLANTPDVQTHLAMNPSGDNRLPYLYVKPDHEKDLVNAIRKHWAPSEFALLKSEDALKGGLFGEAPHYTRTPDRIGDYLLIPQGSSYLWWSNRPNPLLGRHGGLSRTEMVVPLIAVEF